MNDVTRARLFGDGSIPHGIGQKVGLSEGLARLFGTSAPEAEAAITEAPTALPDAHPTAVGPPVETSRPGLLDAVQRALTGEPVNHRAPAQAQTPEAVSMASEAAVEAPVSGRRQQIAEIRASLMESAQQLGAPRLPHRAPDVSVAAGAEEVGALTEEVGVVRGLLSGSRKPIIDVAKLPTVPGTDEAATALAEVASKLGSRRAEMAAAFRSLRG